MADKGCNGPSEKHKDMPTDGCSSDEDFNEETEWEFDDDEESEYEEEDEDEEYEVDDNSDSLMDEDGGKEGESEMELEEELPNGFYIVEAVREKRLLRGKPQYLIKWKDWPESANTWEPMKNLMNVSYMIDEFEASLGENKECKPDEFQFQTVDDDSKNAGEGMEISEENNEPKGPLLSGRLIGAKKRKSIPPKRFTQVPNSNDIKQEISPTSDVGKIL